MPDEQCPICSHALIEASRVREDFDASRYKCPQCGTFSLTEQTKQVTGYNESKKFISAWIRRQNKLGNRDPVVAQGDNSGKWFQSLQHMGFPTTFSEKTDELLKAYATISGTNYKQRIETGLIPTLVSDIAGENNVELASLNILLYELG
jgi:hypothetical protein